MTEVLFTDEFDTWWDGLSAAEQDSVDRVVRMLIQEGASLRYPYSSGIQASARTPICASYVFNTKAARTGSFMRSIPNAMRCYCWAATKPGTTDGMKSSFRLQIVCIGSTWKIWRKTNMAKARNFKELQAKMSPERQAANAAEAARMLREMPLEELRTARHITQTHLAELLGIKQASVSKMERRTDMYIGTLSKFIQAMGGQLEIRAVFPEGSVRITQFSQEPSRCEPTVPCTEKTHSME